jgi:DNA end-binding protein Ku
MVAIPVVMYIATESQTPAFHLLHKKCLTRPKQVLHCEKDNEYFGIKDTVRGYEFTKGQYVVLDERDFERVPIKTAHTIDIQAFVEAEEIDPIYYLGGHYLEPEETGLKPFRLLHDALEKTERVGIAKVSFQRREHLCCLRPLDNILALHTLHYPDEIKSRKELVPALPEVTQAELAMATSLVKAMARSFEPKTYHDGYRKALAEVIEAKLKGKKVVVPAAPQVEITDLMAALRASVERAKKEPVAVR